MKKVKIIMRNKLITLLLMTTVAYAHAQSSGTFIISAGGDFIKTDIRNFADKAQIGAELNYYLLRNFTVSGGFEFWSAGRESLVLGMRFYPHPNIFTRFRGLIGANQVALGGGYSYPINKKFKLDGIGDFYFDSSEFAFRVAISYVIR
jgi:hypothetical protein